MPAQYRFSERSDLARARRGLFAQFGRSRAISRGFEGELFVRWLGQVALGPDVCVLFSKRGGDYWLGARSAEMSTWDQAGRGSTSSGLLFQAGVWIAVAFFAVFRFLCVYRPADPARGLGDRAETAKRRPRPGGETVVISPSMIVMVLASYGAPGCLPNSRHNPGDCGVLSPLRRGGQGGVPRINGKATEKFLGH